MNIDEAITTAEQLLDSSLCSSDAGYLLVETERSIRQRIALLRFVKAYDECTDALPVGFYGPDEAWREWGKLKDARAAVDEALG